MVGLAVHSKETGLSTKDKYAAAVGDIPRISYELCQTIAQSITTIQSKCISIIIALFKINCNISFELSYFQQLAMMP